MNGVNINLFQFEYDLTWMAFFMDAEGQTYTRYGGREDADAESHLNKASLVHTMQEALRLHLAGKVQHANRYQAAGKPMHTPEDIPTMAAMLARRDVKCIHCHDVKVAELRHRWTLGEFTRDMVFTYPVPSAVGLQMNADRQNQVEAVAQQSPAAKAGVRVGDVVLSADGQRVVTFADFSRVLELTPPESELVLELRRGQQLMPVTLELTGQWRRSQDPSWRESLHVAGPNTGLGGKPLSTSERRALRIAPGALALRVNFIWGAHTKQAGVRRGDVIIAIDGQRHDMTGRQLHAYCMLNKDWGDQVSMVLLRDGKEKQLSITFPTKPPWQ